MSKTFMVRVWLTAAWLLIFVNTAFAQPVSVIGPVTAGHIPQFNSTTIIKDSGFTAASLVAQLNLANFGASGSAQTTTANCTAGSPNVTLAAILDFANVQDILLNHCGAAFVGTPPSALSVTQKGTTGTTPYAYRIACVDSSGGVGAAIAEVAIANGNATTSITNEIDLAWTAGTGCAAYVIWRNSNNAGYAYINSSTGTSYRDTGPGAGVAGGAPFWVPATPPSASLADWLVATIVNGGGTTSLILSAPAVTAGTAVFAAHDDTRAWNAFIAALNATPGLGVIPSTFTVRLSGNGSTITSNFVAINGNGATIIPAGTAIPILAAGGGTSNGGTIQLAEGSTAATLSSTAGFLSGYFISAQQPAFGNPYHLVSPVVSIAGSVATLAVPGPINFYQSVETATLSGTPASGDVLNIVATSGSISGSPVTISYTMTGGDTLVTAAHQLAIKVNANANLAAAGITAIDNSGGVVDLLYLSSLTVAWSQSVTHGGGGSEAIALANTTWSEFDWINPILGIKITNLTGDGRNLVGTSTHFIELQNWANGYIGNIFGFFWTAGSVLAASNGYANKFENISANQSGNAGSDAINFFAETSAQIVNLNTSQATGFGIGLNTNWAQIANITANYSWGRNIKFYAAAQNQVTNATATSSWGGETVASTNFAFFAGTYKNLIQGCYVANGASGLWTGDSFDRLNTFTDCTLFNNTTDVNFSAADVGMRLINVTYGTFNDRSGTVVRLSLDTNPSVFGTIAAPSTPSTGFVALWMDSTQKVPSAKNDAGTGFVMVAPSAAPANNFATGLSSAGALTFAQPSFANLSGSATCAQLPALIGDVITSAGSCTTVLGNIPNETTMAGDILATNIVAPGTPAAGKTRFYVDSTQKVPSAKNDAGTGFVMVGPNAGSANNFVTALSPSGGLSFAQPSFANISGTCTTAQACLGLTAAAVGDIIYASATTPTWSRLADVATGSVLVSGGLNTAPAWSASPTITTSLTTPLLIGGTGTTGTQQTFQTTTGNGTTDAFVWKRGNNGGTTAATLNNTGLMVGSTAPVFIFNASLNTGTIPSNPGNTGAGIVGAFANADAADTRLALFAAGTGKQATINYFVSRGTLASPTAIQSGDLLGGNFWAGSDGSNYLGTAGIVVTAASTFNAGVGTAHLDLYSGQINQSARVWASGGFSVGTNTDPGAGGLQASGANIRFTALGNVATTSAVCYNTGSGLLTYDGTIGTCTVSDERLKNFTGHLTGSLERLVALSHSEHFGYFQWRDPLYGTGRKIGVGAQTVAAIFPELTETGSDGLMSLAYDKLTVPIIEAIAKLKADHDNLHDEMAQLRKASQK